MAMNSRQSASGNQGPSGGHGRKAAEILKISLKTLYNKLHEYGEM